MKSALTATLAVALGLASLPAVSATITLTAVSGDLLQSEQSPCIFENDSCDQGAWIGTELPNGGNVSGYDEYSPTYTGAQITGVIGSGNPLQIGLNINEGGPAQTLSLFQMLVNNVVVDTYSFAGTGNVPAVNNGNGKADYLLGNFSAFGATDTVQFHFVFNNANDGTEQVFLVGQAAPVPLPAAAWLLLSGLAGLGFIGRRRATSG